MAKSSEKQLYATLLDIRNAADLQIILIEDLQQALKDARAQKRKTERHLKKGIEQYKSLYGRDPAL